MTKKVISAVNQQERLPINKEFLSYYLVGFVDGEGCFSVSIKPRKRMNTGWDVDPMFQVYQHIDDRFVLETFKNFFKCGYIVEKDSKKSVLVYVVDRRETLLNVIIPFFDKHKLITSKRENFLKFKRILLLMKKGKHLEKEGLREVVKIACSMNKNGRERKYKESFILNSLEESSETIRRIPIKKLGKI
jgi:hypothetical protein